MRLPQEDPRPHSRSDAFDLESERAFLLSFHTLGLFCQFQMLLSGLLCAPGWHSPAHGLDLGQSWFPSLNSNDRAVRKSLSDCYVFLTRFCVCPPHSPADILGSGLPSLSCASHQLIKRHHAYVWGCFFQISSFLPARFRRSYSELRPPPQPPPCSGLLRPVF